MPYQLDFRVLTDEGGVKLAIKGILQDDEYRLLNFYLEAADQLMEVRVAREGVPASFELKVENGQVVHVSAEYPSPEELAALLHRLRPFILTREPASFDRVCGIVARCLDHQYTRGYLKELRQQYRGDDAQALCRVSANGDLINSERTLMDWLNGYEYHRELERRERVASLHRLMPLESSMPIFMDMLGDKVNAIFRLADLVAVMLGKQNDIKVHRRKAIMGVDALS